LNVAEEISNPWLKAEIRIPVAIAADRGMSPGAKLLLGVVLWRNRNETGCYAGLRKLGEDIGLKLHQTSRYLKELEDGERVTVERRSGRRNSIRPLPHKAPVPDQALVPDQTTTSAGSGRGVVPDQAGASEEGFKKASKEATTTTSSALADGGFALTAPVEPKSKPNDPRSEIEAWFENEFWPLYPRKVAKAAANKAAYYHRKLQFAQDRAAALAGLCAQLPRFQQQMAEDPSKVPHAATWLNGQRWEDEPDLAVQTITRPSRSASEWETEVDRRFRRRMERHVPVHE
jgi:hypothetical protein